MNAVTIEKECSCGKLHTTVPSNAKPWIDEGKILGWMWNCDCKSTLFVKTEKLSTAGFVMLANKIMGSDIA